MKGVAALNVYKKVAVIRRSTDSLAYEDGDGQVKTLTDLGQAASTAVRILLALYGIFIIYFSFSPIAYPFFCFVFRHQLLPPSNPSMIFQCLRLKWWKPMTQIFPTITT